MSSLNWKKRFNMRWLLLIFALLLATCYAGQEESLFQQGVQAFQNGSYADAITHFENAAKQGQVSASLYYNLGNAYYKTDEIGRAMLNYERARRLAPNDADIDFNLQVAQLRVVDKIASPETDYLSKVFRSFKNMFTLPQWTLLAIILYVLLAALLIIRLLVKNTFSLIARHAVLPVVIVLVVASFFLGLRIHEDATIKEAIILDKNVAVLSGPLADATEVFALHEGVKVRIMDRSGEYVRIRLSDGKDGWVSGRTLETI
jgi:tetratricopeptide (TPR) repeat protein